MTEQADQLIDSMRKKPTQERSWRTVRAIFEATAQILERNGEGALNTNRVAERAGVSIGTLYQYFPSMDAIILAMIGMRQRQIVEELERMLAAAEAADEDPAEHIRLYIRALVKAFGIPEPGLRPLYRRAWMLDHLPACIAMTQETAVRSQLAFQRRAHPDFPPPETATLFVATRAVMGAIRAAVLEDSPLPGTRPFEDALFAIAMVLLHRPASADGAVKG